LDDWIRSLYIVVEDYDLLTLEVFINAWSIQNQIWPSTYELHIVDDEGEIYVFHKDADLNEDWQSVLPHVAAPPEPYIESEDDEQVTPVEPVVEPVAPVEPAVEPVAPVEPTVEPVEPVEPAVEPVTPVEPAVEPVAPVEPVVAPVEPSVEPVAPVEPTVEPTVEPVEPAPLPPSPTSELEIT
jgi:hypothetical protein